MYKSDNRSRRNFLEKAGCISMGLAGTSLLTGCASPGEKNEPDIPGNLFKGRPVSIEDRIQRVKVAALGMQRYDWEQGTMGQAFYLLMETAAKDYTGK